MWSPDAYLGTRRDTSWRPRRRALTGGRHAAQVLPTISEGSGARGFCPRLSSTFAQATWFSLHASGPDAYSRQALREGDRGGGW